MFCCVSGQQQTTAQKTNTWAQQHFGTQIGLLKDSEMIENL